MYKNTSKTPPTEREWGEQNDFRANVERIDVRRGKKFPEIGKFQPWPGRSSWLERVYPAMPKAVEWTVKARHQTPANSPYAGLLPADAQGGVRILAHHPLLPGNRAAPDQGTTAIHSLEPCLRNHCVQTSHGETHLMECRRGFGAGDCQSVVRSQQTVDGWPNSRLAVWGWVYLTTRARYRQSRQAGNRHPRNYNCW
jgi:hypothetical protein